MTSNISSDKKVEMLGTIRENFQALSSMELEPPSEKDIETINDVAELEKMVSSHTNFKSEVYNSN